MAGTFLVAGESVVDIVLPSDGGAPENAVGGSCLNVAVGLSRLEVPTTLMTRIGDDELGELVAAHVQESRVALSPGSVVRGGSTSTATAHLDASHAATYDFELSWDLPRQDLDPATVGVHVGSLGTTLHPGRAAVLDLVEQAVRGGTFVSYHPNVRPFFLDAAEAAWGDVREIGRGVRLVKLSDEDLALLRPGTPVEDACRE